MIRALQQLSSLVWLFISTSLEMGDRILVGRAPFRWAIFSTQADRVGFGSVPLVALVSFFLGTTMALLTGYQLQSYGTQNLVPGLVTVGFTRELGPLITGIMIAARIGAAFTAELGTMTVSEEVEAIEAMGIGPLRFLVSPRALAVFLLMPSLSVVSCVTAIAGGALICATTLEIPTRYFFDLARESLVLRDLVAGIVKSYLFGMLIGLISCFKGLTVRGGATGVGDATTSSVVTAITTVIGADMLVNMVLVAFYD